MKKILYLFIATILVSNCTKDTIVPPCTIPLIPCENPIQRTLINWDTCFELPMDINGDVPVINAGNSRRSPFYHSNAERISFVKGSFQGSFQKSENINTNICDESYENGFMYFPSNDFNILNKTIGEWNDDDWGLIMADWSIWKVKMNGDSLTKVTNDNNKSYLIPTWCKNGEAIFCYVNFEESSPYYPTRSVLLDIMGNITHVFPFTAFGGTTKNGRIPVRAVTTDYNQIGYVDLSTNEFIGIFDFDPEYGSQGIEWLDDNHIIWMQRESGKKAQEILKVNINTLEVSSLFYKPDCVNLTYRGISPSPNGNGEILLTRQEYRNTPPHPQDSLYYYERIEIMDTNTGEEWILEVE